MKYINRTGNECEIIGRYVESSNGKQKVMTLECRITKGVTTATGLVFHINGQAFEKDWKQV